MAKASQRSTGFGLLVAAFDFGTTYSGYAFSFRDDPLKIHTNQNWVAGSEKLISLKTPTCVLLKQDGQFHSFGFEAENKYTSLAEEDKHHGWRLFRRFKMLLHNNKKLSRASTVEDIEGKSMQALPIFTMSIKYLRDHLLKAMEKQTVGVEETDIQYVITVPAIWDDSAKQFMREAAIKAGMDSKRLKLALEPEAASVWCQHVTSEAKMALSGAGTRYMVVDLGGGTADISVHERLEGGKLKEIHKASGGPWGGIYVDENYMKMLETLFGKPALDELKKTEMVDFFDIQREFETKKRSFKFCDDDETVIFRISTALKELSEKYDGRGLVDKISAMGYDGKMALRGKDKLRVNSEIVKAWFDGPISQVITHIKDLLKEPDMGAVSSILLVGGFGECQYTQERIANGIRDKRLIVPTEAGLSVLKGAVRFGHDPNIVSTRVMKYTYGIRGYERFDEKRHPLSAMKTLNDVKCAANAFVSIIKVGQETTVDCEKTIRRDATDMNSTEIPVFRSTKKDPILATDDGSESLGLLKILHSEGDILSEKVMDVTFVFGDTELLVKVRMRNTGNEEHLTIDCLK